MHDPSIFERLGKAALLCIIIALDCGCSLNSQSKSAAQALWDHKDLSKDELLSRADNYRTMGQPDDALFYYASFLEKNPSHAGALQSVGEIHFNKGNMDLAQLAFEMSLASDPRSAGALENMGRVEMQRKHYDLAKEYFQKAVSTDPKRWRSHNGLGLLANQKGHHDEAIQHLKTAMAIDSKNPLIANNLSYALFLRGDVQAAEAMTGQILRENPAYQPAVFNHGLYLHRQGRTDQALSALRRIQPEADAYNNVGYLSMAWGDLPKARQYFEKAIEISPHYHKKAHEYLQVVSNLEDRENAASTP
ncbi:MAG: hypothetical protein RLZ25_1428 [Pseudomonadota bacterium]|jgi:Flp pilus assembly protein TadD